MIFLNQYVFLMKKYYLVFIFLSLVFDLSAQSIRKNYQEMTESEQDALVGAFYQLRLGADLVNDLAQFHGNFFNLDPSTAPDIHFNLPDEPQRQIFFPWHRMQMFEMEQAMQEINPNISIPWWDSSVDQSTTSALWDQNFMGQFNANWGLNRNLGGNGPLPTPAVVAALQAMNDFLLYSDEMERGAVHRGAHVWTGGAMATTISPRDPIFYLHHTNVDRLWAEWEEANPGGSSHIITSMIRYDGTYVFDGETLPLVDPDDIVDSKTLGVFYADNQLAQLFDYSVSNTYSSLENFYYQFLIEVGNGFIVPIGTNSKIESVNEIRLLPGFIAEAGSNFIAKIDTDNNVGTSAKINLASPIVTNQIPFEYNEAILDVHAYDPKEFISNTIKISTYPNPVDDMITIEMNSSTYNGQVTIYDMTGRVVTMKKFVKQGYIEVDNLQNLSKGVYLLKVVANGEIVLRKKIIKK